MRWLVLAVVACFSFASIASLAAEQTGKPQIDVVFCLDCSGSMGPVIENSRSRAVSLPGWS